MPTLEEYLSSDYLAHKQEISGLDAAINAAARTFIDTQDANGWPYVHRFIGEVTPSSKMSVGTTAMVLVSIGRILGKSAFGQNGVPVQMNHDETNALFGVFKKGLEALSAHLEIQQRIESDTFGENNPLTVSHVAELMECLKSGSNGEISAKIRTSIKSAEKKLGEIIASGPRNGLLNNNRAKYQINSFVAMRAIRSAKIFEINGDYGQWRRYFEETLHEQLSFSAIPDSRFDPAELAFSLEGLLLCAQHAVDAAVIHRVVEVLGEKQNTSSHWRPSKPFLASDTGEISLPISVEVANSLTRSITLMDTGRYHDTYSAKALPLLHRFWAWIQARAVRGSNQRDLSRLGWHSEHVNVPDLVHTWDTSQVVEFMAGYRALLAREISNTSLRLSGLIAKRPPRTTDDPRSAWDKASVTFDSNPTEGPTGELLVGRDAVYNQIGRHFVEGWADGSPTNFSMLLYGPPGTGKTSVAKELSRALQMPLITVTVSDFLGAGGANVEARAKAIFQTLEHQGNSIILFDEIDSFLLDRDSKFYRDQDSLFQFLTPGMLPKIHDLRDARGCIFIIATNYENRIDPAIKRTGRIDQTYLVSLPNAAKRRAILIAGGVDPRAITRATLRSSVFLGYGDLTKVAREFKNKPFPDNQSEQDKYIAQLASELELVQRASSLMTYLERVKAIPSDFSVREFDDMVRLADEVSAVKHLMPAETAIKELKDKRDIGAIISPASKKALGLGA